MSQNTGTEDIVGSAFFSNEVVTIDIDCDKRKNTFPLLYSTLRVQGVEKAILLINDCLGADSELGLYVKGLITGEKTQFDYSSEGSGLPVTCSDEEKLWIFLMYYESLVISTESDSNRLISILKRMLSLDNDFIPAIYYLTLYELKLPGDTIEIERGLDKLSEYRNIDPEIILREAELSSFYGNKMRYEKLLRESIEVGTSSRAFYLLGIYYHNEKAQPQLALECFKKSIEIDSCFFEVYRELGWVYYWQGQYSESLNSFHLGFKYSDLFLVDIFEFYYLEMDVSNMLKTKALIDKVLSDDKHIVAAVEVALYYKVEPGTHRSVELLEQYELDFNEEQRDWLGEFLLRLNIPL